MTAPLPPEKRSPNLGGARAGSGRPKGSPNRATRPLKALAQKHGPEAIKTLLELMRQGETHAVRVAAARELLDRGFGKPATVVAGDGDGGPIGLSLKVNFVSPGPRIDAPVIEAVPHREDALLLEGTTADAQDHEPCETSPDPRLPRPCHIVRIG